MAAGLNTKGKMNITELDFDAIKSNLKTYMKGQTTFTDYDFEGSGLSVRGARGTRLRSSKHRGCQVLGRFLAVARL